MGNIVFVIYRPARQVLAAGMRTVVTGGGGTGAVDSVNGQTGVVVLTATDVGADTAGTAAAAVGTHVAASDPHPQYLTPAEGNAAYDALGAAASAVSTHVAASDPHPQYNTQAEGDARYERNLTAGANITIDRTNPAAPVISASGGGGAGGAVDSVNGQTGVVVLDTDDIAEGVSNLYFTNGRAAAAAPVQTVDGQTGAVSLSSSYAPLSHVGGGGAAHSNAVAAGAAGFMTGADKTKLDGIAAGAQVNVPTDLSLGTITATSIPLNSSTGADVTLPSATTSLAGLQSAADKTKLGGIAAGATANADTDSLAEGATNKYFTEGRVRSTALTGLSLLTGGVISAADGVLSALGKLQKQISDAVTAISGKQDTLVSGTNIKTVNGSSLLGAGDLAISGSGMANPMTTAGDIIVGTSGGAPGRLGMGASLQVLRVNSAGTALEYATPAAGGLTNLSESKNTASPNVSVPAVVLKVSITEANGDVVLEAKGTGATLAQVPDSAIAGGNKRGEYATDWQKKRTAASQVASGQYACILGGQANTALGQYSIAFGNGSTANGKHALAFGENSSAAGQDAYAIGYACSASGDHGWATGYRSSDRGVTGMQARACGGFYASGAGAAQSGWYPLTYQTTDATASIATTNQYVGGAAAATNQVTLPDNSAYRFDGKIVARSSSGNVATWDVKGLVKRGSGAGSTALVGTPTVTQVFADAGASAWTVSIGVNTTIGCLTVTVTGAAGTTIRWNAAFDTVEVTAA